MAPLIVIPTFNEKTNIANLVKTIRKIVPETYITVVDDNSPDGTAAEVGPLAKKDAKVTLIKRTGKGGRGSAVLHGFKEGLKNKNISHFIEMDADFSHDPNELKKMLTTAKKADVVLAARYVEGSKIVNWPIQRRVFSFLANKFARLVLNVPIADYTNGYRCYSREVLEKIDIETLGETGYAVLMEMSYVIHKHGFKITQVPSVFVNRRRGQSNTTLKEILNALNAPLRIKSRHK